MIILHKVYFVSRHKPNAKSDACVLFFLVQILNDVSSCRIKRHKWDDLSFYTSNGYDSADDLHAMQSSRDTTDGISIYLW